MEFKVDKIEDTVVTVAGKKPSKVVTILFSDKSGRKGRIHEKGDAEDSLFKSGMSFSVDFKTVQETLDKSAKDEKIRTYFEAGLSSAEIMETLSKQDDIHLSLSQVNRIINKLGLRK